MEGSRNEFYSESEASKKLYRMEGMQNISTGILGAALLCSELGTIPCLIGGLAGGLLIAYDEYKKSKKRRLLNIKNQANTI